MSENFTFWLVLAVGISAFALLAQAICLFLMYRTVSTMQERLTKFMPRAETMVDNAERTIAESRQDIRQAAAKASEVAGKAAEIVAKANEIMDIAQVQVKKIDGFIDETTVRARAQFDRIETVVDDSLGRVHHSVGLITDTATRPARELNAVTAGLRAAIGKFFERQRHAHPSNHQEEHEPVGRP